MVDLLAEKSGKWKEEVGQRIFRREKAQRTQNQAANCTMSEGKKMGAKRFNRR
jgi:hypothetical protein